MSSSRLDRLSPTDAGAGAPKQVRAAGLRRALRRLQHRLIACELHALHLVSPLLPGGSAAPDEENDREFRVFGLRRSGNHAVLNWLLKNGPDVACFLNCVRPAHHDHPFVGFGQSYFKRGEEILNIPPRDLLKVPKTLRARAGMRHRELLMYSYEDLPLVGDYLDVVDAHHDEWLGRSRTRKSVIIMRDPYNCFASRSVYGWLDQVSIDLWKTYAREYLGRTDHFGSDVIGINYNRWCVDEAYRGELAAACGLQTAHIGVQEVTSVGGGSSFDSTGFDGDASAMKTSERWKKCADDPDYRALLDDAELHELSDAIFGPIPGVAELWQSAGRRGATA